MKELVECDLGKNIFTRLDEHALYPVGSPGRPGVAAIDFKDFMENQVSRELL